jgi:hypothetical protein
VQFFEGVISREGAKESRFTPDGALFKLDSKLLEEEDEEQAKGEEEEAQKNGKE